MKPFANGVRSLGQTMRANSKNDRDVPATPGILTKSLSQFKDNATTSGARWIKTAMSWIFLVQRRRNQCAAERIFCRLIKGQGGELRWLVTDKLRSDDAAHRTIMPTVNHIHHIYANNRAEVSHEPIRQRERHMRGFSSSNQAQRFLALYGFTQNLFRLGRHLMQAVHYRILRPQEFQVWKEAVCA